MLSFDASTSRGKASPTLRWADKTCLTGSGLGSRELPDGDQQGAVHRPGPMTPKLHWRLFVVSWWFERGFSRENPARVWASKMGVPSLREPRSCM